MMMIFRTPWVVLKAYSDIATISFLGREGKRISVMEATVCKKVAGAHLALRMVLKQLAPPKNFLDNGVPLMIVCSQGQAWDLRRQ